MEHGCTTVASLNTQAKRPHFLAQGSHAPQHYMHMLTVLFLTGRPLLDLALLARLRIAWGS